MNFKVITGYQDYLVSESGEIFSLKSNRNLKPYKTTKGYLQVRLNNGKAFHVHRLVAEAFIPNPDKRWESTMEVERTLGYKNTNIGACCNGKMKRAYGFIWRYIE